VGCRPWVLCILLCAAAGAAPTRAVDSMPPPFAAVRDAYRPSDVSLLDRHGEPLHQRRIDKSVRRFGWVALEQISPALREAVLRAEDRRFYAHGGVDVMALVAAGLDGLRRDVRRGASTITMQVAGMLDASLRSTQGRRSLQQKWRQMWAARAIEAEWSKEEILEAYLNLATFRGEIQGVGAAAGLLFGKLPHGLDRTEGCVLASLLKRPSASASLWEKRTRALCADDDEGELKRAVRAVTATRGQASHVSLAPHAARRLLPDGLLTPEVRSSLVAAAQRVAVASLRQNLLALRERHAADGAVVVVDNATGEVLAYVGGSGDLSSAVHVDGVRARRQAGSTLKPFLYGLALERRLLTASSLLDDSPLELPVAGGLYRPQSYDGSYRGLVTVRTSLAGSLNIPAVRTLALMGEEIFVQRLRQLGFRNLSEEGDYYGPSLALGSVEVSLWELVNAYRTLANGGRWSVLRWQSAATPGLEPDFSAETREVYSPAAAFVVADILADRDSRATTFGTESVLSTRYWAAVKTGTSKEMRDNWCLGFSQRYSVGVWVGNLNGEPMHDVSGVAGAAPVWREVMDWLHSDEPSLEPNPPAELTEVASAAGHEWFLRGTEPMPLKPSVRPVRVLHPVSGTVIALDPDIPRSRQRMVLQAEGARPDLRWRLDASDLGVVAGATMWEPIPGRHTAALVDVDGAVVDSVAFIVRGAVE